MHKTAVFSAVATGFAVCLRQKGVEFFFWVCYNVGNQSQGSYIGNTTASQAVKAGSIPVPCSKKKDTPLGCSSFFCDGNRTDGSGTVRWTVPATSANTGGYHNFRQSENANRFPYPAPKRRTPHRGVLLFSVTGIEPIAVELSKKSPRAVLPGGNRLLSTAWRRPGWHR